MNDNEKVVSEIESADNSASPKKHGRLDIVALIVSLIIALSIWIYVVNTTQSEIERTITVSVDISGQIYEDTGMTIFSNTSGTYEGGMIDYSNVKVDIKVKGLESVLDKYSAEDYKIKVNTDEIQQGIIQSIVFLDWEQIKPAEGIEVESIAASVPLDLLYIDKQANAEILLDNISVNIKNIPANATNIKATPKLDKITISGPEQTVNSIKGAQIGIDLLGVASSTVLSSEDVKFIDENGTVIKTTYVEMHPEIFDVEVVIEAERSFLIAFKQAFVQDGQFKYTPSIEGDVTEIVLKGDTALMPSGNFLIDAPENIKSIPSGTIKFKDLKLPEGLSLGAGMEELQVSYIVSVDKTVINESEETTGENS